MGAQVVGVEADPHAHAGGVVGDRQVGVAELHRCLDHLHDGGLAVGGVAVGVQVAANVSERHQLGQLAVAGGFELAAVLAQLGRDRLIAQVAVDLVLVRRAEHLAALDLLDAPLRHLQPARLGLLAHGHVVRLRSGEVLQQVAVRLRRDDAQVHLHARVRHDRGFRVTAARDLLHPGALAEPRGQGGRILGCRDQIDVADRLGPAPQRPRLVGAHAGGMGAQRLQHLRRQLECVLEQQHRLARGAAGIDGGQDLRLFPLPHAREVAHQPVPRSLGEVVERADLELLVQQPRGAGADAGQPHHVDQPDRPAPLQLGERLHRAGRTYLIDLLGDRAADPGQLGEPALLRQRPRRLTRLADAIRCAVVGEHAELIRSVDLVQVAEHVEHVSDVAVA